MSLARTYTVLVTIISSDERGLPGTQPLADHICRALEEGVREMPGYLCASVDAFKGDLVEVPPGGQGVGRIKAFHDTEEFDNNKPGA